jgi:hypothetical protein
MTPRPIAILLAAGLAIAIAAAPAGAQYRGPDTAPVRFYADIGYVNLFDYPKWLTLGPEVEFRLGRVVSLNPELMFWIRESRGSNLDVVPGATLNFRLNRLTLGFGGMLKVGDWAEAASGAIVPKVQFGYLAGPTRIGVSLYYLNTTDQVVIAFSFGMRIGGGPRREPDD